MPSPMPEEKSGQNSAPAQSGFKWELEHDFVCRVTSEIVLCVHHSVSERRRFWVRDVYAGKILAEGECESLPMALRAAEIACTAIVFGVERAAAKPSMVWLASVAWSAFTERRSARIETLPPSGYVVRVWERTQPEYLQLLKGEARSLDEAMVRCEELLRFSGEVAHVG